MRANIGRHTAVSQAARDKQEVILDFAINYRAEQENMELKALFERLDKRLEYEHKR
ncbi:hypothetical protein [Paenibacillus sp. Soil787]|uniref:hypothetical protein n=1 Tax=Paenibacillus sp. Soil787 TaxID=1736411 RepID=UPI000AD91428|nr:hypothetical protein [Paenibacillus sp. Soil787]